MHWLNEEVQRVAVSLPGLLNIAVGKIGVRAQAWNRWSFVLPRHLALGVVKCLTLLEKKRKRHGDAVSNYKKNNIINMLKYLSTLQFCI